MILLGLTGGMGSGKSSVAKLLADRGAIIIDSDAIARDLQVVGSPVLLQLVEQFGEVLADDGSLDRAKLASIVFPSPEKVKALNAIMHPAIGIETLRRLEAERASDNIVVLDIPLLVENPRKGLSGILVVDVDPEIATARVVQYRGLKESDVRARIALQSTREERLAIADRVIDNSGTVSELENQVDGVWSWITALPPAADGAGSTK